ncbi:hypothetical protein H0I25_03670 [Cellulophaga sp. HaHa_2_95]|uniref:hypothetical protein n=1 Tax=unclassified Cellulophaga TaxID=2634405 RepID=UPI001C4E67B1|nr:MULTISPECIES: hypothetical protein [unclassified Cellulophaga]QXP50769.1 hypothetical protein H0I24_11450 [Cellulophaga sp. HaHa_2_1]QXP56902.1 hypothetical protein H0I25_03670 [Cellulophaga sp. HaHa_2_95]
MSFSALKHYFNHTISTRFLKVLLLIDVMFVVGHLIVVTLFQSEPSTLLLDAKGLGYPELFQYVKYSLVIAFSTYIVFAKKRYSYLPFIGLFIVLLLDDVFQIHSKASYFFAYRLKLHTLFGLKAVMYGQLVYIILLGSLSIILFRLFYRRTTINTKKTFTDIFILLVLFLFFGVGIDIIHQLFLNTPKIGSLLTILEEGGEMISLSVLVWYFFFLMFKVDEKRNFLKDCILIKCCLKLN